MIRLVLRLDDPSETRDHGLEREIIRIIAQYRASQLSQSSHSARFQSRWFRCRCKVQPIWACNIAYRTALFKDGLLFDQRYNRKSKGIGGGEDAMMFQALLDRKTEMGY